MKITPQICPRCKQQKIDRDNRRCLNMSCLTPLLFPGDDGHGMEDEEWFLWMDRGPMTRAGWYRRAFFEERVLSENQQADMEARALAQY